jgi:polyhydroxyalkanoate synthesis regulator phasin
MFNPFGMGKDLKGMEKMIKPALEKFMKDSGFVKKDELELLIAKVEQLEKRIEELERKI